LIYFDTLVLLGPKTTKNRQTESNRKDASRNTYHILIELSVEVEKQPQLISSPRARLSSKAPK